MKKILYTLLFLLFLSCTAMAKVPDISGYSLDGVFQSKVLSSNGPVFLYFMSPYCSTCVEVSDNLKLIFAEYDKKNITVVIVARGNKEKIEKTREKLSEVCNKVIVIHDQSQEVQQLYKMEYVPQLMYVTKDLEVLWHIQPEKDSDPFVKENLVKEIKKLLDKEGE